MPDAQNVNALRLVHNFIKDPVLPIDNLADRAAGTSRISRTNQRKRLQDSHMIQNSPTDLSRRQWVIPGDVITGLLQVSDG